MKIKDLEIGKIYNSKFNGPMKYKGTDTYCGETTFKFMRISDGVHNYIKYENVESTFEDDEKEPKDTKQCPECEQNKDSGMNFCANCGRQLWG